MERCSRTDFIGWYDSVGRLAFQDTSLQAENPGRSLIDSNPERSRGNLHDFCFVPSRSQPDTRHRAAVDSYSRGLVSDGLGARAGLRAPHPSGLDRFLLARGDTSYERRVWPVSAGDGEQAAAVLE